MALLATFFLALLVAQAAGFATLDDSDILVQTKLIKEEKEEDPPQPDAGEESLAQHFDDDDDEFARPPPPQRWVVEVLANMTSYADTCTECAETGFQVVCRGKSLRATFEPSTSEARVIAKFPRQNIGWRPAERVQHKLTLTLRSNGVHTFNITDGANPSKTWSKDFRKRHIFPRTRQEVGACQIRAFKKHKKDVPPHRLSTTEAKCYSRTLYGQKHCLQLASEPRHEPLQYHYWGNMPPPAPSPPQCYAKGDPHYKTFRGQKYNFQGNGTYVLSYDPVNTWSHMLQAYNCPAKPGKKPRRVSQAVGMAMQLAGHLVTFYNGVVKCDGIPLPQAVFRKGELKIDVGDGLVVIEGPRISGLKEPKPYVEVRVTSREVSKSEYGYVLDIVMQTPYGIEYTRPRGLCEAKGRFKDNFVAVTNASNLFSSADLTEMERNCCPGPFGCSGPGDGPDEPEPSLEEVCSACTPAIPVGDALSVCGDVSLQEACALDYCASCGDIETVYAIGEDDDGTPDEEIDNLPGAYADPHCRNVRGESFDVLATGNLTFVHVPRSRPRANLRVEALIEPIGKRPCSPTVIKRLVVTGVWLHKLETTLTISPGGNGFPVVPSEWHSFMINSPKKGNLTLLERKWGTEVTIMLQVHGVSFEVMQRTGRHSGVKYLDLKVQGLDKHGEDAGGILGLDSHSKEAKVQPGCNGVAKPVSLAAAADEEEEEGFEDAPGGFLSMAWVM